MQEKNITECEARDVKGYYKLAREGKIKKYTGISAPYEEPEKPTLRITTENASIDDCVKKHLLLLKAK